MENEQDQGGPASVVDIHSTTGGGSGRKPARRKPAAARRPRKTAAPRKPAATRRRASTAKRRRPARGGGVTFEGVIRSITGGVTVARAAIAEASGTGASAVLRTVGRASTASRDTVSRLAREWKAMDPRKKARILAALLGAAAAASAPLVRRSLKK
jgi:hypothetical protein